jgi:ribosomal protein L11 methyltransferase
MRAWLQVRATFAQAPEDWSPYAEAFTRAGCPSSLIEDDPPSLSGCMEDVRGAKEAAEALAAEIAALGAQEVRIETVRDEDWSAVWRASYMAQRIGRSTLIVPTWEEPAPEPGDLVIRLDPGQAFGTGEHPTTRLCLQLMEGFDMEGKEVLDVGCGSGILAIAAALRGASVAAGDIEPAAVEIAARNAAQNNVALDLFSGPGLKGLSAERKEAAWDAVLSNIVSATLIGLCGAVARALRPGGDWIVSGVLEPNWREVAEAAARAGFRVREVLKEDGWMGARLTLSRADGAPSSSTDL